MEKFKIELFQKEYKRDFPYSRSLSQVECEAFQKKLSKKLFLIKKTNKLIDLVNALAKCQTFIEEFNAEKLDFNLLNCLKNLKICPPKYIYINWFQFDEIDEMYFKDLNQYFTNIWFPGADDIEIFDDSLSWILSVRHDGILGLFTPILVENHQNCA